MFTLLCHTPALEVLQLLLDKISYAVIDLVLTVLKAFWRQPLLSERALYSKIAVCLVLAFDTLACTAANGCLHDDNGGLFSLRLGLLHNLNERLGIIHVFLRHVQHVP